MIYGFCDFVVTIVVCADCIKWAVNKTWKSFCHSCEGEIKEILLEVQQLLERLQDWSDPPKRQNGAERQTLLTESWEEPRLKIFKKLLEATHAVPENVMCRRRLDKAAVVRCVPLRYPPCTQIKELEQKSFSLELRAKVRQLIIAKTFQVNIARTYATPQKIIWTVPVEARGSRSKHTALTKQFCDTPWISWLKVTSLAHKALLHQSNITTTSPSTVSFIFFDSLTRKETRQKLN